MWLIVDGHFFLHRSMHLGEELTTSYGVYTGGIYGFITSLRTVLRTYPSSRRVIVVWDDDRSSRRIKLLPSYKKNREPKSPEELVEKALYSKKLEHQKSFLKYLLYYCGVRQVAFAGREGDDVAACVCDEYPRQKKVIISEDRDLLQLVDGSTSVYHPIKEEEVNKENFLDKTGAVDVSLFLVAKAILGDVSDGIPGVSHVGKKTVDFVLAEANDCYRLTFDDVALVKHICSEMPVNKSKKLPAKYQRIIDGEDVIRRNLELMDLRKEPFSDLERAAVRDYVEGGTMRFDRNVVMAEFVKLEFENHIKHFSSFSEVFGLLR